MTGRTRWLLFVAMLCAACGDDGGAGEIAASRDAGEAGVGPRAGRGAGPVDAGGAGEGAGADGGAGAGGSAGAGGGAGAGGNAGADGGAGMDGGARAGGCTAPQPCASPGNPCPATDPVALKLTLLSSDLDAPIFVTQPAADPSRLFVVERGGRIRLLDPATGTDLGEFMSVPDVAASSDPYSETGLLGFAFHPRYPQDPRFFVNYTALDPGGALSTRIASFEVMASDPDRGDPESEAVLLEYAQPQANHNGGMLAFGPDGCLFVGSGDGGGANDEDIGHVLGGNGQSLDTQLGKLLRLDVDDPQAGAPGNLSRPGNPHVWDYGLRNPWRFSFDRATGDLYIGDVGQAAWEEIDVEPRGTGHRNYGWNIAEGSHCRPGGPQNCDLAGLTAPVDEYTNEYANAVIGGYVYRGRALPSLRGFYLYADWSSRRIRAFTWNGSERCGDRTLDLSDRDGLLPADEITSFGEDAQGELYVVTMTRVYRVDDADARSGDLGVCEPGAFEERACVSDSAACRAGTRRRSCSAARTWDAWGACSDDVTSCGCGTPVAAGSPGELDVDGEITQLVPDEKRCLVYALNSVTGREVIVFDTLAMDELTRIPLAQTATDLDLSPNGVWLVAAQRDAQQLVVIDADALAVARTLAVQGQPEKVEVGDDGVGFYTGPSSYVERVDLSSGIEEPTTLWGDGTDLELAPDGARLLATGDSAPCTLDVATGARSCAVWSGLPESGQGRLLLSPGGQHGYYRDHQFPADSSGFASGRSGWVLAEDHAGTFAIGPDTVFNAETLRPLAALDPTARAAALTHDDAQLWWFSASGGRERILYANVAAFVGSAVLGQSELAPGPLSSYTFVRLLRDPARDRLYGLDAQHELVVVIDATALTPVIAIDVGSAPSDMALDPSGEALFVSHRDTLGIARVDLSTAIFDGFLRTTGVRVEVEALASGRLAIIDEHQWTTAAVIDGATGAVEATAPDAYEAALATTADGTTLFVCESGTTGSAVQRYDVSSGTLQPVGQPSGEFLFPARVCVAMPDGSGVFYAGHLLDGFTFAVEYDIAAPVVLVTPDGRLATTASSVLDAATGSVLGPLPASGSVQAVSPDSTTLYVASGTGITSVDLTDY